MEFEWKKVDVKFLRGNKFHLCENPIHCNLHGLEIEFNPSKSWTLKNPHMNPVMKTDLIAGKEIYKLPRYFRKSTIKTIRALLPSPHTK